MKDALFSLFSNKNDKPLHFRFLNENLEQKLLANHRVTLNEVAVPLGQELASRTPCQPEPSCTNDTFTEPIYVKYVSDFRTAEVELQVNIQSEFIESEKKLSDEELKELTTKKDKLDNDHRIKEAELKRTNKSKLNKGRRYARFARPLVGLVVLFDVVLSGSALEPMKKRLPAA